MKNIFILFTLLISVTMNGQSTGSSKPITREEATELVMAAKQNLNLTFAQIAEAVGKDEVWVASVLLGQNTMSADEAHKTVTALGLGANVERALQMYALRGTTQQMPPTDPLVYRFYEIIMIYGPTLKAVIQEKFGEGIMSAIDYSMHVEKIPNPNGDRVRVTMEGKFLAYKKW